MLNNFQSLKARLLLLGLVSFLGVVVLAGATLWYSQRSKAQLLEFVDQSVALNRSATVTYANGLQMGQALRNIILDPANKKGYDNYSNAGEIFNEEIVRLLELMRREPTQASKADELEARIAEWRPLQFEVLELAKGGQISEAIAFLSPRETPAWRAVRALLLDQVKQSEKQAEHKRIELVSVLNASITSAIAVSSLVLVLVVLFTIFVGRGVFRQVGAEPAFTATALSRIAGGDLTHQIELGSADPKSILAAAHEMQTHLRELINKIVLSSEAVLKTSDSLRSNSTNISLRTEEQSSATSAIAAAVEQLTVSIGVMSEHAAQAATLSLDAEEKVREGLNGVTATTDTISRVANSMIQSSSMMDELSSKVDGINGIARTIRDIADQTNLLALNAAIEAARAGEQGRGFAVVADEVRKLAERTTASTLEISTMITGVQNSTKVAQENLSLTQRLALEGAQYTEEVQSSVLGLNQATSSVRDAVDSIKLALQEQSAASTDIAQRIEQIAQDTEEVHLSTANSSERAQELVELAHMLREQVSRFRTA